MRKKKKKVGSGEMIGENSENEERELPPEDMFKLCFILLNILGGKVSVPAETFENFPKDTDVKYEYDEANKTWLFYAPTPKSKRKRGVLRPNRRLILP